MSDGPVSSRAPRPGDPASTGPRPGPAWRDVTWLAAAVGLAAVTGFQLVRLAATLVTSSEVVVGGGGAFLGFLVTVVWLLTIWWLVAGAWRRTVWGCPFDHTLAAIPERRCPRHALVEAGATDAAPGDDRTEPN
ncbi:hypothetical protein FTX61_19375 [Nitriliruptoraceae bacterium ZYF776]|nr:hypothetical protein [Profundirhabdus halotolerans]